MTCNWTVHFHKVTLASGQQQTNSRYIQRRKRRLAKWPCTLTVHFHKVAIDICQQLTQTNKQTNSPQLRLRKRRRLYTLTKWCCTLLTVRTVHFWLYRRLYTFDFRLYTVDCTDCTLLTVQTVHRRLYRLYTFDFTKSHKQTNKELTPQT